MLSDEENPRPPEVKFPEHDSGHQAYDPFLSDTVEMDALPLEPTERFHPEVPVPSVLSLNHGEAVWLSIKSPAKLTDNEDSVSAFPIGSNRGLLVVADGLGGHRGGKTASQAIVGGLKKEFANVLKRHDSATEILISGGLKIPVGAPPPLTDTDYRSMILDQIETTNRRLLKRRTGAATTLALIELEGSRARSYHVGDSPILIVGQRGQLKYATISHSPVGYAVEAGMLSEHEAIYHENRHLVSNVVGAKDMSVELGPWIPVTLRDTILLASDGLFDNLLHVEIVDRVRSGNLVECVCELASLALARMCHPHPNLPSKPDDLTILAYRRTGSGK